MTTAYRGIFLTSAEVQSEGLATVLDNIARTGATAISPTLGVMTPGQPGDGTREPPLDVAGQVRLLDRPLWGRRELYLKSYVPYEPDRALWASTGFPAPAAAPPSLRVDITRQIIEGARARGLAVFIQINPFTLPGAPGGQSVGTGHGLGSADARPRRVDGTIPERAVAGIGCLNHPGVRRLAQVRLLEAVRHYGDADGVFLDWPEYPCYFLEDCFTCFCEHCQAAARAAGYDWDAIERDSRAVWDRLHQLTTTDLQRAADGADWPFMLARQLVEHPGLSALLRFKAATVRQAVIDLRATMDGTGASGLALGVNGFPPPWCLITGMDYGQLGQVAQAMRCKLFTFHWPMITRWWSESLLAWNAGLDEAGVLRAVTHVLDLPAPPTEHRGGLADYGMPRPDEPHPITPAALTRKLNQAVAMAGSAPCAAYVHSYRPPDEFARVLAAVEASQATGMWVQRYGYLSDEKLAILQEAWGG